MKGKSDWAEEVRRKGLSSGEEGEVRVRLESPAEGWEGGHSDGPDSAREAIELSELCMGAT